MRLTSFSAIHRAAIALALITAFTSASRAATVHYIVRGETVYALGESTTYVGDCVIDTSYYLEGTAMQSPQNGSQQSAPTVTLDIEKSQMCYVQDPCSGPHYETESLSVLQAEIPVPSSAFVIPRTLDSAKVEATGEAMDYVTGEVKVVHVRINATGIGSVEHGVTTDNFMMGHGVSHLHLSGTGDVRDAQTSVSVTDTDGNELILSAPFQSALSRSSSLFLSIDHP